jgi:molybdate transport system regulatory protein
MSIKINALLALHRDGRLLVGHERIKVLEAVAEHGSIAKAAKAAGFSYKAGWDAVNALNNLTPSPAFVMKTGGRTGGGAEITAEGRRLIAAFHKWEEKLSEISSAIAEAGLDELENSLLWSIGVKISTRNVFRAEVIEVKRWPVDVEVTLKVSEDATILAIVTNDAVADLELEAGRQALALIKAPFVNVARPTSTRNTGRNCFGGIVTRRIDAERNSELLLDIGDGKTMTIVAARQIVEDLGLGVGETAVASFSPTNVILAVE